MTAQDELRLERRFPFPLPSAPSDAEVDRKALETTCVADGQLFPESYRDFCLQYGYGRTCGLFILYPPLINHGDAWSIQSGRIREFIRLAVEGRYLETDPDGQPGMGEQLVPFAMSENGDYLCWHVEAGRPKPELPIYVLAPRMAGIRYGGGDLYAFFRGCVGEGVKTILGPGYEPLPVTFQPIPAAAGRLQA